MGRNYSSSTILRAAKGKHLHNAADALEPKRDREYRGARRGYVSTTFDENGFYLNVMDGMASTNLIWRIEDKTIIITVDFLA